MAANPFAEATAYEMLAAIAQRHGARPAIVFGGERITFADLRARADALASGLAALGLRHGDALAIWLPNRPLWFVAQYAAARLGLVVVALNPRYRARELTYILAQSHATALLLTDHLGPIDYFEALHEVIPELPSSIPGELAVAALPRLRSVIVDAEDPYPGCLRVSDVLSDEAPPLPSRPMPASDDVFTLLYTSGTRAAFTDDGWFRTGDLAVQDGRGHTIFRGRLKETLRISHFMVAPGEIEAFLQTHPDVDEAFVVGVPDPETNEAPVAYVIAKPHARLVEAELRAFCRGKIASYKIPKRIRFVADVPRTPGPHGDKVQRGKLREQAIKETAR